MKLLAVSCFLAALGSTTSVLAEVLQDPVATTASSPQSVAAEATSFPVLDGDEPKLEVRQNNVVAPAAGTVGPLQYPSITTQWVESTIGSTPTYLQIIYTQTFAAVPDQWQTAGKGQIGYGTLTKHGKRDSEAKVTGYLQPVVLELQTEVVTQYLQAVTEVIVLETFTILPNMTYGSSNDTFNGTYGNFNGTNGTYLGFNGTYSSINGTFNGTLNGTNGIMTNITTALNYTLPPTTLNTGGFLYPTASALY